MSYIKINHTLFSEAWNVDVKDVAPTQTTFYFSLVNQNSVDLKSLIFRVSVSHQDTTVYEQKFPPEHLSYVTSDQDYLQSFDVGNLKPNTKYKVTIALEMIDHVSTHDFSFMTGMPAQPYPSWIWDGEHWQAPVSRPLDEHQYVWNEPNQEWDKKEQVSEQ